MVFCLPFQDSLVCYTLWLNLSEACLVIFIYKLETNSISPTHLIRWTWNCFCKMCPKDLSHSWIPGPHYEEGCRALDPAKTTLPSVILISVDSTTSLLWLKIMESLLMPFFPNSTYNPLCLLRCSVVSDSLQLHGLWPARLLCPWDFTGKNTAVGCHFLLQGIFLTQIIFLHLLHLRVDSSPSKPPGKPWSHPNMGGTLGWMWICRWANCVSQVRRKQTKCVYNQVILLE